MTTITDATLSEALAAADEKLGGVWLHGRREEYAYRADEVGCWVYAVPRADLEKLGRKLLAGDADAYGEWAQASGGELLEDKTDPRLDDIAEAGGNVTRLHRCQCGEVFGGTCEQDTVSAARLIDVRLVPASEADEARKSNNSQAYARTIWVVPSCHDAIEALEDSQFVDADRSLVIGAAQ